MRNNAGTFQSFERIEARLTRPANSGRAGLIQGRNASMAHVRMMVLYRRFV